MTNATKMHMANWTKMVVSENGGGTGNITLGAVNGYPTIADTLGTGKSFHYVFRAVNNTPIEAGVGVMIDAVTLRRDTIYAKIVNGIYSAGALTAGNIAVGSLLYTADTKEMLQDLVREGLEFNYGNVSGGITVDFTQHCIRANLTADTTINVNADTLPPAGVHHEIILKLTSNNNPALTTPFQAGFMVTLAGTGFFVDGGVTGFPSMRLNGAGGSEMTLRLTNIAGGTNYRVENISKHEINHNLGVIPSGNFALDIRRPWNIGEFTGGDNLYVLNAISPNVGILEPAHFTFINNGSVNKTLRINTALLSVAGSRIGDVLVPIGYKVDLDVRRNHVNAAQSYEVKIGDVNYNQTASGLATTWNPSDFFGAPLSITNNNKMIEMIGNAGFRTARAFGGKNSGKYRIAFINSVLMSVAGSAQCQLGICTAALVLSTDIGASAAGYSHVLNSAGSVGRKNNSVSTSMGAVSAPVVNDLYGINIDFDSNKLWFTKNDIVIGGGNPEAGTGQHFTIFDGAIYFPAISLTEANASAGAWTIANEIEDSFGSLWPSYGYWTA